MNLVTLKEAAGHLRLDVDSDGYPDPDLVDIGDLELKVAGASAAVLNYLKSANLWELARDSNGEIIYDSNGDPEYAYDSAGKILRYEVRAAVLLMLGFLYRDRDDNREGSFDRGYLPMPVTALLYPLRDPALR